MMKIFFYSSMSSATSVRERGAAGPIIRKSSSSPPHAHTLIWQSGVSWAKGKTERRRMRQRRERKREGDKGGVWTCLQ